MSAVPRNVESPESHIGRRGFARRQILLAGTRPTAP